MSRKLLPSLLPAARALPLYLLLLAGTPGCAFDSSRLLPCQQSSDCPKSLPHCVQGFCVPAGEEQADAGDVEPDGTTSGPDAAADGGQGGKGPPPQARVVAPLSALLGDEVLLDGGESSGHVLSFSWIVEDPRGQRSTPPADAESGGASARFRPLLSGTWRILLTVADAAGRQATAPPAMLDVPGFRFFSRQDAFDLEVDAQGALWVASDHGAFRLDPRRGSWTVLDQRSCNAVALGSSHAWFALRGNPEDGVLRFALPDPGEARPAGAPVHLPLAELRRVRTVRVRGDGEVWVGGLTGIVRFPAAALDGPGERYGPPGGRDEVLALLHGPAGTWLGSTDRLCFLATGNEDRCTPDPLPVISDVTGTWRDASILDLGFDARQRLLIATDGKGLFRLEEEGCTPLAAGGNGLDGRLGRLGLDATGEIWVAGGRVLLRVTSRDEPLTVPVPQGQEALGEVRSLRPVSTPARGLWLAGGNGVAFTGLAPP